LASIVDSVFEESPVNDSSANIAYIHTEEAYEDRLATLLIQVSFDPIMEIEAKVGGGCPFVIL